MLILRCGYKVEKLGGSRLYILLKSRPVDLCLHDLKSPVSVNEMSISNKHINQRMNIPDASSIWQLNNLYF